MQGQVSLNDPSGLPGQKSPIDGRDDVLGQLVLGAVVVVLGPVLPVTVHPVVFVPVETMVDGFLYGKTPYSGSFQEDGQVVPPGVDGGDDLAGISGEGSCGGCQGVQVHGSVEQLPPRDASFVGLVPFVGLLDGLGLVEHRLEDLGKELVGGDALARACVRAAGV